ncbi:hypothetical protein D3C71_1305720 [compost metagenome]
MVIVERIPQAVVYQTVEQLAVTELCASSAVGENVRRAAHVLLAAGDDHVGLSALNRLRRQMQRFQSRTADVVDGDRRDRIRQPAFQRRLTRRVLPGARRQHLAEDHFIYFMGGNSTAFDQGFYDHAPQFHRRVACQSPLKTADSRTQRTHYHDIFHLYLCAK